MPMGDNLLVIWMDFEEGDSFEAESTKSEDEAKFISAPRVSQTLNTSDVEISGNFTVEEAQRLADIINSGSLPVEDRKSTRLNSSHVAISYAVFCLKKKNNR